MTATATTKKTQQRSYFAKKKVYRFMLDDGESFIEHQPLDEGTFQAYQDLTSQIRVSGNSTEIDMKLGEQRKFLFENLVIGWNLVDEEGEPVKFNHKELFSLPPHIMTGLFDHIHESNEILRNDSDDSPKENKK